MKNRIETSKKNNIWRIILILFVLVQPILDLSFVFNAKVPYLFSFSVSTIVRYLIISVVWFYLFLNKEKKYIKYLLAYLLYIFIHCLLLLTLKNDNYQISREFFYLLRFLVPLAVLYLSSKVVQRKKDFKVTLNCLIFIISGSIVALNLARYSLGSYTHQLTRYNIFDWFSLGSRLSFLDIATKGFFMFANQISAILFFLVILELKLFIAKDKMTKVEMISSVLLVLSMVMIGTKVALVGAIIFIFLAFFIITFCNLNKDKKMRKVIIIALVIAIIIGSIPFSPFLLRRKDSDFRQKQTLEQKEVTKVVKELDRSKNNKEELVALMSQKYRVFSIPSQIIEEAYPYKEHPLFWLKVFHLPYQERTNNRVLQVLIAESIRNDDKENNLDEKDRILREMIIFSFGLGVTVTNKTFSIEKDFVSQYYNFGVIGLIMIILPYLYIAYQMMIFIILGRDRKKKVGVLISLLSFGALASAAYFSGNVIDSVFVMIILAYFAGSEFKKIKNENIDNSEEYRAFFRKIYKSDFQSFVKKEIIKKKYSAKLIVTANPEILQKSLFNKKIRQMISNKKTIVVADGISIVKASHYLKYDVKERIAGIDLTKAALENANKNGLKLSVLGTSQDNLTDFSEYLTREYPGIKQVDLINGYVRDKDFAIEKIIKKKPDIILVALGSGAQELLLYRHLKDAKGCLMIGVGGTIDVLSGNKKRAPRVFIKLNLEWLYRILSEPKRLGRFLQYNLPFIFNVLSIKKRRKK